MKMLSPNDQRAKTAILLIWIVLGMDIISLVSDFFEYQLLQSATTGNITMAEANANDARQDIIGILHLVVYIISAVTFIMWFRRAYNNLHKKLSYLNYSEGWAAGSWFVPVLNLFRPYQIMKELYVETDKLLKKRLEFYASQFNYSAIGIWWALWIISGILGQFVIRWSTQAETVDDFIIGSIAALISDVIAIPLAFITVKVIKNYSALETELYNLKEEEAVDNEQSSGSE